MAMTYGLPNPKIEGYRTAHKQNKDGSYKYFVMPADLVPKRCNQLGGYERISRREYISREISLPDTLDVSRELCTQLGLIGNNKMRKISEKMEQVYRCRHHDFGGMTVKETARKLGMKPATIRSLLWRMFKVAPQLFPILTSGQARAWHMFYHEGMSHNLIASAMDITKNASEKLIKKAKKKLDYHKVLSQRMLVMSPERLTSLEVGNEIVKIF
ncbi:hypothetical protein LCGC14_1513680 [marine sediment metagenome]|uniref:Uncharacterized protein n=1 Tax=marine sediment metagenome TaxID=412755 RepID=A0A0F9LG97_9ZZZZ